MIRNCILYLFLFLINCSLCYGQRIGGLPAEHRFTIIGQIDGLKDSTKLHLYDFDIQKDVDSASAQSGRFTLQGTFREPKQLAISTAYPNYRAVGYFWVDQDTVYLTGHVNRFKQAVLKGSKTEDENQLYKALLVPIQHKKDSLSAVKRKLQYRDSLARTAVEKGFVTLEKEVLSTKIKFIRQHPDSYVSAEFLRLFTLTKEVPKSTSQSLYAGLSGQLQKSSIGQRIQEYLQLSEDVRIGRHFVDFVQVDLTGRNVKLSDYKGKYLLLEFWGSGCIPCRAENPQMVDLYQKYHPKGLEIVSVSLDTEADRWKTAVSQDKLPWPQLTDLKGVYNRAALIYDVSGIPSNFLIDSRGIIIGQDLRREKLEEKLAKLFGK